VRRPFALPPGITPAQARAASVTLYPVGTPVRYWPGVRAGEGRESVTRTPAWLVGGHTTCVSVDGYPGGIALTHVEVQP
jgi:hypothetical protein